MAPAKNLALLRRDATCNALQCLSPIARGGIAMCIVLVTLGSIFAYYWAFIRGRRDKDVDSQIDTSTHELSMVNHIRISNSSPHQRSPYVDDQALVRRPTPAFQMPPNTAWPPSMYPPQFILPGPPMFAPAYVIQRQPVFGPIQAPVAIPPPPLPPLGPVTSPSGVLRKTVNRSSQDDQYQTSVRPRQPSPGYASTVSEYSPGRGRSSPPQGGRSQRGSPISARSRSSSLGTKSRGRFEKLVAHSGVTEPVDEHNEGLPKIPSASNSSTHRRHSLDNHAQEYQSRIGHPRVQSVGEPRLDTRWAMNDVFGVGDTRVGGEHRREFRNLRQPARPQILSAFFGAGESRVGRPGYERCNFREEQLSQPPPQFQARKSFKVGDSSIGRKDCVHKTSRNHGDSHLGRTQAQDTRGSSSADSVVSSTGAICSFEGSDQFPQGSVHGYSSQRYCQAASRSVSTELGLARPHRALSNPESLVSPCSVDSRDLSLASEEEDAEDDGRHGQHN
ncbi:hypothetical protein N0V93_005569 [Gnomoniopsis smithogilvyi]|uniref:Transmembrane protein n=1 Tax=Gnomoniopsis smithogilvyi TaxID=1191159 RepID=A0A9W8YWV4_9PEZI|nr:hypothetical protein N0V93_005569 [Gnomoniopsis smithogilvyi]